MPEYYTFRFDYEGYEDKLSALTNFIKAQCSKYAIFDEVAEKTGKLHYQGKLMPVQSLVTFRRKLLLAFPFCHRSNYSIAPVRKDSYDIYISKDGKVVINNVWTEEEIQKLKDQYVKPSEYAKVMKEKKPNETWSQRIASEMEKQIPNTIQRYIELIQFETLTGEQFSCEEFNEFTKLKLNMLEFMLSKMGSAVKTLSKHVINGLFYGIINHFLMKSDAKKVWVKKIYQNLGHF